MERFWHNVEFPNNVLSKVGNRTVIRLTVMTSIFTALHGCCSLAIKCCSALYSNGIPDRTSVCPSDCRTLVLWL